MAGFGTTPLSTTTLGTNQFPVSAVAVPGETGGNLTALEGGPESTDSNGNKTAPVSMYVKDGNDLTLGTKADSAATDSTSPWSAIALLKSILAKLLGTIAVTGTFWQATQPISAASLPLPTGASTAAKQPALGTAGTASSDVITVQGIASMTAFKVDGSGVTQPATLAVGTALTSYGSNPSQTATAGADTQYKFGASGTTPFTHCAIQNNSNISIFYAFDQSTTTSTDQIYVLSAGQVAAWDRSGTVLHFSSASQIAFGGTTGITVEAFA